MPYIKYFLHGRETIWLKMNAITGGVRHRTNNIRFLFPQEANGSFLCFYVYIKVINATSILSLGFCLFGQPACFWTNYWNSMLCTSVPSTKQNGGWDYSKYWTHETLTGLKWTFTPPVGQGVSHLPSLLDPPQATHTHSRGTNHAGRGEKLLWPWRGNS